MIPTNEQIIAEANRRAAIWQGYDERTVSHFVIEVMRENWTPPEPVPVDPDVLAFREWETRSGTPYSVTYRKSVLEGKWDYSTMSKTFLAGARMAREREQERANGLVAFAVRVMAGVFNNLDHAKREARKAVEDYSGEA